MKNRIKASLRNVTQGIATAAAAILWTLILSAPLGAQRSIPAPGPAARITSNINSAARMRMHGTLHPMARPANDAGTLPGSTQLHGISMVFSKSDVQKADLKALLKAQQDPASPLYHNWLTPDQFAARFGMAQADLDKAAAWLEQQGFSIDRISRGHDRIYFSGTAAQVNTTFATTLHYYNVDGKKHFAPATELSLPAALATVVLNIGNLDDFKPQAMHHKVSPAQPDFTSGVSGNHFVAPGDIATIYNINPALQAGWTGRGQGIAIVGQSDVDLTDIQRFQAAAGMASPKDPVKVLVPTTGNAGDYYTGDMAESDLDLEWSGAIAPDATIYFVFTGDGGNAGVFDSLVYAIETRIAPIISVSYGGCEIAIGSPANVQSLDDMFQQGSAQGQTLIAASGDDGASGCFRDTALSAADRTALSISFPADSVYFTGVGGTQFNEGTGTYWDSKPGTDILSSALSYIPEAVWNEDDPLRGLGSSGGGVSTLYTKPDWQAGVPGIPNDGMRDSPDVALDSAGAHDGLLFCTSDTYFWQNGQQASCDAGFRDSASSDVTEGGGTSFAAPIFAGMIALLNQQQNSTGQGLLNPKLYALASDAGTYASAFHDITVGSNRCTAGETGFCPNGPTGYDAGTGYDLTTGLGSINFNNLMTAWGAPSLSGSTTTLTLLTATPTTSAPVQIGIAVAAVSGSGIPTGSVTMTVDGTTDSTPITLESGSATYNASLTGSGNHIIVATYSGDSTYAASTSSLPVSTLIETQIGLDMPSSVVTGSLSTILFRVEPTSGLDLPDGSVTALLDGNAILFGAPLVNGVANYTGMIRAGGKHTLTATYSGSTKYASSSRSLVFYAVTGTTMSVVTASGTPAVGGPDAVTVNVTPSSGSAVPAGELQVLVNGAALTPAPVLDTKGTTTFPVTFLHAGTQTVSVSYPGDTSFAPARDAVTVAVQPGGTTTSIAASNATPARASDDTFTITVGSTVAGLVPGGNVQLTVDGKTVETPLGLVNGTAAYTTSFATEGDHTVSAAYIGSPDFAASTGSAKVSVPSPAFSLAASDLSMPHNGSGVATITVAPAAGYTGVIHFVVSEGDIENTCYSLPDLEVDGGGPTTASLKLTAATQGCSAASATGASVVPQAPSSQTMIPGALTLAAAILLGLARARRRWQHWVALLLLVAGVSMTVTGCGGSSSHTPKKGSYTLTVTGTDTKTSSIQNSVKVNVTID